MLASESVVGRIGQNLRAEDGLPLSQFGVLEALWHLGPLCQRDLGLKIRKSSGNMTMVVDNLEKRALVDRRKNADDRRVTAAEQKQLGALCRKLGLAD